MSGTESPIVRNWSQALYHLTKRMDPKSRNRRILHSAFAKQRFRQVALFVSRVLSANWFFLPEVVLRYTDHSDAE